MPKPSEYPRSSDNDYSEEETMARAEAALKRMLATPPKPHSEMKLGKSKSLKSTAKERQASKGRVRKGKSRI
jgi:hypothetical protein